MRSDTAVGSIREGAAEEIVVVGTEGVVRTSVADAGCTRVADAMNKPQIASRRILVVDDEPLVCDAVKMMLTFDGHSVETASSAKEALTKFGAGRFDVVITDYAMPSMKGDELAAAIKKGVPGQPVIMVTAYAEMLRASGEPLTGVDFVISKPFLLEHLREAIQKVAPETPASPSAG
ncbi:MAG TPA: response regulator [Verrucomicrobiota bacterium]|nr:response regulator [Verrucomicrobiota bacterium]